MTFDLSEYATVAERIQELMARHPEGSLQSELQYMENPPGWLCKAYAYRTPADERPGIGHAFEPVPGKTPYTRDSEAQNAETSAWGRAIVALGFETKKIASAEEVRNRQAPATPDAPERITDAAYQAYLEATQANGETSSPGQWEAVMPTEPIKPSDVVLHWSKNKGRKLGELTPRQLSWYANDWKLQDTPTEYDHLVKAAAVALSLGNDEPITADPYADVPF